MKFSGKYTCTIYCFLIPFFSGCHFSKEGDISLAPLANRVLWNNLPATNYSIDSTQNQNESSDSTLHIAATRSHKFEFLGADTVHLVLHEFAQEFLAYAAFTENATARDMEQGLYQNGNRIIFYHGRYLGEWRESGFKLVPSRFLQNSLVFQGEELFLKPVEFQSFPLLGKIAKSERVILQHFMGKKWNGPVFTVQYHCNEDTATLFRGLPQSPEYAAGQFSDWVGKLDTLTKAGEIRFNGQNGVQEPLLFMGSSTGIFGVIGCYDPEMALAYSEKMKKMRILWKTPRFFGKNERMN